MRALFFSLFLTAPSFGADTCSLPPVKRLSSSVSLWETSDVPVLRSGTLPASGGYAAVRAWALSFGALDNPRTRIENDLRAHLEDPNETPELKQFIRSDLEAVLSGKAGQLGDVSCLEALLLGAANLARPMPKNPYEMNAVVLSKGAALRIYLNLGDSTSADPRVFVPYLERDVRSGWKVSEHIHSHPFFAEDTRQLGGYTAPSLADIEFYRHWQQQFGLESAVVTNGVFSFRMPTSNLGLFPKY